MQPVFIRDSIYDYIRIDDPLILDIINCQEVQRLRRIKQTGCSYFTYPGATHDRFSHSIGSMHLMSLAIKHFHSLDTEQERSKEDLERECKIALLAALLHDIGHCPFSHALENMFGDHETWAKKILNGPSEIADKLEESGSENKKKVTEILDGSYLNEKDEKSFVPHLISSQLDVDRLDFLVRDSFFSGNKCGLIDTARLLFTLKVDKQETVMEPKGLFVAEEFVLARYHLYWNVSFHKTTRGIELILKSALERAKELFDEDKLDTVPDNLIPFLEKGGKQLSIQEFLELDDFDIMSCLKSWKVSKDKILADLSRRFISRKHFEKIWEISPESLEINPQAIKRATDFLDQIDKPSKYYFQWDRSSDLPYEPYDEAFGKKAIKILVGNKHKDLSTQSDLVRLISKERTVTRFYTPPEYSHELRKLLKSK